MAERILIQGGFYWHYKYDPGGVFGNAVYEVLRVTYNYDSKNAEWYIDPCIALK